MPRGSDKPSCTSWKITISKGSKCYNAKIEVVCKPYSGDPIYSFTTINLVCIRECKDNANISVAIVIAVKINLLSEACELNALRSENGAATAKKETYINAKYRVI